MSIIAQVEASGTDGSSGLPLNLTACPMSLMPRAGLMLDPGKPPRLMTLPSSHSMATNVAPKPTATPAAFMSVAEMAYSAVGAQVK